MKIISFMLLLLISVYSGHGQTIDEWFRQKKTDIKYLKQQIEALQVYIDFIERGYHMAQEELTSIGQIKRGEFNLHRGFFNSLQKVNPAIATYSRVADIISCETSILAACKKTRELRNLTVPEMDYLNRVYANLSGACIVLLEDLISLITDDSFQMKDDERIKRIDAIYIDMKDKYAFIQSFKSEATLLTVQRGNDLG